MEPHLPSTQAGTTGQPARRAMTSKPPRRSISAPVRVTCPSGKMQTTSPRRRASTALAMASLALVSSTGMVPMRRITRRMTGTRSKPSQDRKRTGRRENVPMRTGSR